MNDAIRPLNKGASRISAGTKDQQGDAPAPVAGSQRIVSLDILRGFAVLGILLANVTGFAHGSLAYYWPPALPGGANTADKAIWLAQYVLVDGKFRGLFALLFGAGMVLLAEPASGSRDAVGLQVRRLLWLSLFGLAHFYLLFTGDILFSYAAAGLIALVALNWETRSLFVVGLGLAVLGALIRTVQFGDPAVVELGAVLGDSQPSQFAYLQDYWRERMAQSAQDARVFADGSYREVIAHRWEHESARLLSGLTLTFYETIPTMLIGMALFRAGLFTDPAVRRRWRGRAWAGLVLGASLHLAAGLAVMAIRFPPFTTQLAFFGLSMLFTVPMLLGGALLLTDWASAIRGSWLGERLAQAGQMAFSNYIGTSLVMALLFEGWAGGLFGTLHRIELLAIVALGWALMLTFSRLWLRRFRHGPLEWVWRCLTYFRLFPITR